MGIAGFKVFELIARYKVFGHYCPGDMYVEVYKDGDKYLAQCNYEIWVTDNMKPYHRCMIPFDTKEMALKTVLDSMGSQVSPNHQPDKIAWVPQTPGDYVVTGKGERIRKEQFRSVKQ